MIEHFAGAFPLWLAPTQVTILTVADAFADYAADIKKQFADAGLRVNLDDSSESLNKKIRNAELMKIPYILVIGEKEQNEKTVAVREYRTKEQYELSIDQFIAQATDEYKYRRLTPKR